MIALVSSLEREAPEATTARHQAVRVGSVSSLIDALVGVTG